MNLSFLLSYVDLVIRLAAPYRRSNSGFSPFDVRGHGDLSLVAGEKYRTMNFSSRNDFHTAQVLFEGYVVHASQSRQQQRYSPTRTAAH